MANAWKSPKYRRMMIFQTIWVLALWFYVVKARPEEGSFEFVFVLLGYLFLTLITVLPWLLDEFKKRKTMDQEINEDKYDSFFNIIGCY